MEGRPHKSPVVNADTPVPANDVIRAKPLMYVALTDKTTTDHRS
jgi:hypothetical protein